MKCIISNIPRYTLAVLLLDISSVLFPLRSLDIALSWFCLTFWPSLLVVFYNLFSLHPPLQNLTLPMVLSLCFLLVQIRPEWSHILLWYCLSVEWRACPLPVSAPCEDAATRHSWDANISCWNVEKYISVLCHLPILWYALIVTQNGLRQMDSSFACYVYTPCICLSLLICNKDPSPFPWCRSSP